MKFYGWCKQCGSPITEDDFQEGETEFYPENEVICTQLYTCSKCNNNLYNTITYKLVENENEWEGLTKCDPIYDI